MPAVDTAKGIAILFVVFGHAWRGLYEAGVLANAALFEAVDRIIYAWHIPMFFFLSGLHFLSVVARDGAAGFLWQRILRLLWPMALWTWVFFAARLLAGDAANAPVTWADFPLVPLPPYEHLWFLWALFLVQIGCFAVLILLPARVRERRKRLGFAALAGVLVGVMPFIAWPSPYFGAALEHVPYFAAGIAFGALASYRPQRWMVGLAGCGFLIDVWALSQGWREVFQSLDLVLFLWVLIAALDPGSGSPSRAIVTLRALGRASMTIYMAHTMFSALLRIALLYLGVTSAWVHLAFGLTFGILGPLILLWAAQKTRTRKLLGL
ncbi:MAG: acyltransferase [Pseudomonadota bacterium]